MNTFLTKLAMLVLFIMAVTCAWAALVMELPASLFNIILGILAAFFLLRAFELADKINKLGPYSDDGEQGAPQKEGHGRTSGKPGDSETPDEE